MSFDYIQKLPTADELKESLPFSDSLKKIKAKRDLEIQNIFKGESDKFLLIVGPCSAHDPDAVCDYMGRLAELQEKVSDKIVLTARIYTNKPRTTGEGYKGIAHQVDPKGLSDIIEGMKAMRGMHIRAVKESGLTAADEMLYPGNYPYLDDILSYVAVGARSVENQEHRLTVSGLDVPSGMKNPISGDLAVMLNSVHAAQIEHDFVYNGWMAKTSGNPLAHCILRGSQDQYGRNIPNYHYEDLHILAEKYAKRNLKNPSIVIDTNHANSQKKHEEQVRIAREVLLSRENSPVLKKMIKGFMVESFIVGGRQDSRGDTYGQSITDPCLDWETTETMVQEIAEKV